MTTVPDPSQPRTCHFLNGLTGRPQLGGLLQRRCQRRGDQERDPGVTGLAGLLGGQHRARPQLHRPAVHSETVEIRGQLTPSPDQQARFAAKVASPHARVDQALLAAGRLRHIAGLGAADQPGMCYLKATRSRRYPRISWTTCAVGCAGRGSGGGDHGRHRWSDGPAGTGLRATLAYVAELVDHWAESYDWRRLEQDLDAHGQALRIVDGLGLQYLHVRSERADARPLILTHGWPSSVVEPLQVIDALAHPASTDEPAFHVVAPSLPGFGFSGKPTTTGWSVHRIADTWARLMTDLATRRSWPALVHALRRRTGRRRPGPVGAGSPLGG